MGAGRDAQAAQAGRHRVLGRCVQPLKLLHPGWQDSASSQTCAQAVFHASFKQSLLRLAQQLHLLRMAQRLHGPKCTPDGDLEAFSSPLFAGCLGKSRPAHRPAKAPDGQEIAGRNVHAILPLLQAPPECDCSSCKAQAGS